MKKIKIFSKFWIWSTKKILFIILLLYNSNRWLYISNEKNKDIFVDKRVDEPGKKRRRINKRESDIKKEDINERNQKINKDLLSLVILYLMKLMTLSIKIKKFMIIMKMKKI